MRILDHLHFSAFFIHLGNSVVFQLIKISFEHSTWYNVFSLLLHFIFLFKEELMIHNLTYNTWCSSLYCLYLFPGSKIRCTPASE